MITSVLGFNFVAFIKILIVKTFRKFKNHFFSIIELSFHFKILEKLLNEIIFKFTVSSKNRNLNKYNRIGVVDGGIHSKKYMPWCIMEKTCHSNNIDTYATRYTEWYYRITLFYGDIVSWWHYCYLYGRCNTVGSNASQCRRMLSKNIIIKK